MTGPISSRSTIEAPVEGAVKGLLGLLLVDQSSDDAVIALTAAQLVRGSEVFCGSTAVAKSSADNDRSGDSRMRRAAHTMIEKLVVDHRAELALPHVELPTGVTVRGFSHCGDPLQSAGARVFVHTETLGVRAATLRSLRGHFAMPTEEGGEPVTFYDALVLDSEDGKPLSQQGDAGAVVANGRGEPLGILICGIGASSYAAPVGPLMASDDALRELAAADVKRWNDRSARVPFKYNLGRVFTALNIAWNNQPTELANEPEDVAAEAVQLAEEAL